MKRSAWFMKMIPFTLVPLLVGFGTAPLRSVSAETEFPHENAWARVTPSVVWCNDPESTVTFEVHIVGRSDVARVWLTDLGTAEEEQRAELFDDGTHGDVTAGDDVFTLKDVVVPCSPAFLERLGGYNTMHTMLRVELDDGTQAGHNYGATAFGMVHSDYRDMFEVQDLGNGLSATAYAFFIEDSGHEVFDGYPVATMRCGVDNFQAYQKFYSVMPDSFDFAMVTPGMMMLRNDYAENVPYNVLVTNSVENIGMNMVDNSARFGSGGGLKSTIYHSFGSIDIFDHEVGHTWGMAIGQSLGLIQEDWDVDQGHWNDLSDIQGQMGAYFFDDDSPAIGHFAYNGDETWRLIANTDVEPYSPLELYVMGLIPPEQVPPIHILSSPDTGDLARITATYRTVTIEQIMAAEGGPRYPTHAETPRDYTLAFIVVQDVPFNEAAYAYFSLLSHDLMTEEAPEGCCHAPFYWATGGRARLSTFLPVGLADPFAEPVVTEEPVVSEVPTSVAVVPGEELTPSEEETPASPLCGSSLLTGLLVLPVLWGIVKRR